MTEIARNKRIDIRVGFFLSATGAQVDETKATTV
jgi:hypothetical protein